MPRLLNAFVLLAVATGPAVAAPKPPETLAPSTPWNVNYADDSCRLGRVFGTGEAATYFILDKFGPGQSFRLMLAGPRFAHLDAGPEASLRFGPNEAEQKRDYMTGDLGKSRPALIFRGSMRLDLVESPKRPPSKSWEAPDPVPLSPERIAAIDELIVGKPVRPPVRLALGSLKAPFAALDKCIDQLMTQWGIDVARHATLSRPAIPSGNPGGWLDYADYPSTALFRGTQGMVNFRLSVDETGRATACHIQQSSRPPEFDTAVCAGMMRRARFKPALDKNGKPLASFYRNTVIFQMP